MNIGLYVTHKKVIGCLRHIIYNAYHPFSSVNILNSTESWEFPQFHLQWKQFMEAGRDVPDSAIQDRLKQQAPNKCCSLIYTSGTTGTPKGVMLSHDNVSVDLYYKYCLEQDSF